MRRQSAGLPFIKHLLYTLSALNILPSHSYTSLWVPLDCPLDMRKQRLGVVTWLTEDHMAS